MSSNDVNWISTKAVKVSRSQHVEAASQKPTKCCSRRNWILLLKLLKCASTFCLLLPLSKYRPSKINYSCSNYVVIIHVAVSFSDCALYFCSKVISNVCILFYSRDFFYKVAVVKYIIFVWILMQFFSVLSFYLLSCLCLLSCLSLVFCLVFVSYLLFYLENALQQADEVMYESIVFWQWQPFIATFQLDENFALCSILSTSVWSRYHIQMASWCLLKCVLVIYEEFNS